MRSIECLLEGLTKARAFRVLDHHGSPRQRLERNPVQADRATKRENHNNAADAVKHVTDAIRPLPVRQTTEIKQADLGGRKTQFRLATRIYNSDRRE